jgi:[ribosomal protein S5]-alanine N-acetyltransferase
MENILKINDIINLTEVRESDPPSLVKYLNDVEINQNTLLIPYPYTLADGDFFVNLCREREQKYGHIVNWAIRNSDGEMIGGIGRLMKSDMGSTHKDEFGYWMAEPYRGQGLMTEVVRIFSDYWLQHGLMRMEAVIFPHNIASMRVVEKAGFDREAYCKMYHYKNGEPIDGIMYVKFKSA